jgi:biopolymer transport protein ExbD
MVNLVFLLLVFFLMVATLGPARPVRIVPPETAAADRAVPAAVEVYLDAAGLLHVGDAAGEAALARLGTLNGPVAVHADRGAPALRLAEILRAFGPAAEVRLVVGTVR